MEISIVFNTIILMAILILIGAIVSKDYRFNNNTKKLYISLIIKVAMPSIILSSIFKVELDKTIFKVLMIIFLISIVFNILGLLLGFLFADIFKLKSKRIEISILSAFGNTGFIGIPLCAVLLGPEGALYAAMFDAGVDFTIWTVGVFIIKNDKKINLKSLKEIFNIPLLAIIVGLFVGYFNISVPSMVIDLFDMLAAFAVPLAMFYIGASIKAYRKFHKSMSYFEIIIPTIVKLIILPVLMIVFVLIFKVDSLLANVIIVQSMMPALTLSSVLFAKYARDESLGAISTVVTTLVSLLTIPCILYVVNVMF